MQRIGSIAPPTRYERLSVKERILHQLVLRIQREDWQFKTVQWRTVQRKPPTDAQLRGREPVLSIVDGEEAFDRTNTTAGEATVEVAMEFAIPMGSDEEPSTVLNLVAAELIEILSGDHNLNDEATGEQLSLSLYARGFTPDYDAVAEKMNPIGLVMFDLRYRFRKNKPFDLPNR